MKKGSKVQVRHYHKCLLHRTVNGESKRGGGKTLERLKTGSRGQKWGWQGQIVILEPEGGGKASHVQKN